MSNYSILHGSNSNFDQMIRECGITTVMNAKIYKINESIVFNSKTASEIRDAYALETPLAIIDTLKIANVTIEGPNKTVTGGQYSNPLIKFGKSARLEMQDALGRAEAIQAFGGSINEYENAVHTGNIVAMHVTEDFAPTRLIIGDSFFIDRKSGQQVKVNIMFYQVLPDSIFNLNQDSEGDATVFDMNADLLTTEILVADENGETITHGVFYSIIPADGGIPNFADENAVNKAGASLKAGQVIKVASVEQVVTKVESTYTAESKTVTYKVTYTPKAA